MFYQSTKDSNGDKGPNFLQNESSQSSKILPLTRETTENFWVMKFTVIPKNIWYLAIWQNCCFGLLWTANLWITKLMLKQKATKMPFWCQISSSLTQKMPQCAHLHRTAQTWKQASYIPASMLSSTDYGHTMAKSLILCGPNSNPNPKWVGYKGLFFL